MDKIRVFIVDDAAVVRRLVTDALNRDAELQVVGTAADGRIALSRLDEYKPDIVLLDLEMPEMDGLETLVNLRKTHPRLPVIMFSRFTQRGVEATVHALTLGADDYVPKPDSVSSVVPCIDESLIPKIKALGLRNRAVASKPSEFAAPLPSPPAAPASIFARPISRQVEVIVIGASTGGPNALAELFAVFPANWPVPILVVQHMPPEFTARLAERLTEKSQLQVREAAPGESISKAGAWIAPGDHHLLVHRQDKTVRLVLNQDPPVNSCRPAADVLFRSAAEVYGSGVLAVVLTGMGQDGLQGCGYIRSAGGQIIVQDEASSVIWSMPGAVARAGLADQVLPLKDLGPEILRRAKHNRSGDSRPG